jgi:lysozyme family protein
MSYAEDKKALNKYKLQKRKELNKRYPKGGQEFIKAVNDLRNLSVTKFKNLGVKPVSTKVVEKNTNKENTNKNIVKVKKEIKKVVTAPKKELPQPKAMPQSIKDMRAKNKKTGSKTSASASNTKDFEKTKRIQQRLKDLGADIKVDGIMGAKTRAAMAKDKAKPKKVSEMTTKEVMERGTYGLKSGGKGTYEQRQAEIQKVKSRKKMADKMLKTLKMKK